MHAKLSDDLRHALRSHPDDPLKVEDDETQQLYVIVDYQLHERAMAALRQQEDIEAIQAGIDAAREGRMSPVDEVDDRIRQRLGFPARE